MKDLVQYVFFLAFSLVTISNLVAQEDSISQQLYSVDSGYQLQEVVLFQKPNLNEYKDRKLYYYMKYRTKRIYPFFLKTLDMFTKVEAQKKRILDEDKRETYVERVEDYLFENFKDTVMNMTKIEGMIFSKLIYRNTGNSIFEIIDENMGLISSYWWYGTAKVFNIDIDEEYCPTSIVKDLWIETILNELYDEGTIDTLPQSIGYCIQTKREKQEEDEAKKDTTAHWYEPWNW